MKDITVIFPDLDDTLVRLDGEAVHEFAEAAGRLTDHGNAKSDLSRLAIESDISVRQLDGRSTVARWKVESLSVLLGCLPTALIQGGTMPDTTTAPKKPFECPECHDTFKTKQQLGIHRFHSHGVRATPKATGGGCLREAA